MINRNKFVSMLAKLSAEDLKSVLEIVEALLDLKKDKKAPVLEAKA